MLLDVFGGLAESSLCLLGPREVGSRAGTHVTLSYSSLSPPSLWSVLCWMCAPFVSVLLSCGQSCWMCSPIVSMPRCHYSLLSSSSQVCSCLRSTLTGVGETDLVHLTPRPSHPSPAHLHLDLGSSWAGGQVLPSAPLWPCPLPGCTRPQRVVGRQPRLRTG